MAITVKGLNSYGLAIDSERGSCMRATKEYRLSCTEEAKKIVDRLTLEQKVWLMSGNIDITRMRQEDMPLRYNKDKRKNPVFSRVSAFVVAYSIPFPTLIASEKSVE